MAKAKAVEFDVPIATTGDCYARYLVRIEEIKQSVRIIEQLIDTIPGGSVNASPEGKGTLPEKGQVYGSIEATIQQFELVMHNRGFDAPIGEAYGSIEGPNGELGYYLVGMVTAPRGVSVRPPCFFNFSAFAKMLEGHQLADFVAVLGSLNIIAAELDR